MKFTYSPIAVPTVDTYNVDAAADSAHAYVKATVSAWNDTLPKALDLAAHCAAFVAGREGGSQRGFVKAIAGRWDTGVSLPMVQRAVVIHKALMADPDALRTYVTTCDAPTVSGAATWLAGYAKRTSVAAPAAPAVDSDESPEPVAVDAPQLPTRWDAEHVATAAKALLAALAAQGADDATIAAVVATAARLVTPVRSAGRAA